MCMTITTTHAYPIEQRPHQSKSTAFLLLLIAVELGRGLGNAKTTEKAAPRLPCNKVTQMTFFSSFSSQVNSSSAEYHRRVQHQRNCLEMELMSMPKTSQKEMRQSLQVIWEKQKSSFQGSCCMEGREISQLSFSQMEKTAWQLLQAFAIPPPTPQRLSFFTRKDPFFQQF